MTIEFKITEGSEKQIKWANDIADETARMISAAMLMNAEMLPARFRRARTDEERRIVEHNAAIVDRAMEVAQFDGERHAFNHFIGRLRNGASVDDLAEFLATKQDAEFWIDNRDLLGTNFAAAAVELKLGNLK